MTAQDADEFFAVPFVQQVSKVIDTAQLFFAKQTLEVPVDQPITLPPAVMLSGAIYAAEKQAKQVFIGYDGSPIPEISALLQLLPYGLRKDISFRTDVRDGGESYGTAINFGSLQAISELVSKDYLNSPNTDKYTYFSGDDSELRNKNACDETANKISGQLFRAITSIEPYELFRRSIGSWDEFGSLIGVNGSNDPLKAAISMVSEDALADAIAKTEMAPDTLHRLETAAPSKYKKVIISRI